MLFLTGKMSAISGNLILPVQAGASCALAGLIWFVQVVHYPAYRYVGAGEFRRYQTHHQWAVSWVVGPLMLVEMAASLALVVWPVEGIGRVWAGVGSGVLAIIWAGTALWQVPLHTRLLASGAQGDVERMVRSNWLRTVGWTLRAALSLAMIWWGVQPGVGP